LTARWYIVNVLSGYESKVIKSIQDRAKKDDVTSLFEDFIVPTENRVEIKKGKKVNSEKKIFPGYLMIKMELTDFAWNVVKNTKYVAKLLGSGNQPVPITEQEIARILKQVEDGKVAKEVKKTFDTGENVKIMSGVFQTFNGIVQEVDDERCRLKILVSIFGRETPVDLSFDQVEKLIN
jgi:transcriptional antiterminator NusG